MGDRSPRGRVVIVTGASAGIGRDTALALSRAGAHVVGAARDRQRLEDLAAAADNVLPVPCDVTIDGDRKHLVDLTGEKYGRVDALINNAGIGWNAPVVDTPPAKVRDLFDVNVIGLIDLTQRVLPGMLERGDGDIVNISSLAGYTASPPFVVYCATKHAVTGFTNGLRREVAGSGVRAHLVAPGPVRTEWFRRTLGYEPDEGAPERRGHGMDPERVVRTILRCLTASSSRVASVPRIGGAARLGEMPPIQRVADYAIRAYNSLQKRFAKT